MSTTAQEPAAAIWVVAEADGQRAAEPSLEALGDARELAGRCGAEVVAICPQAPPPPSELAEHGATRVVVAEPRPAGWGPEERAAFVAAALEDARPLLLLVGGTAAGKDLAGRVAALRGSGLVSEAMRVEKLERGEAQVVRVLVPGRLQARCTVRGSPPVVTLRPGVAGPGPREHGRQAVVESRVPPASPGRVVSEGRIPADPATVDIAQAERILGIGRGVGSREMLALAEELARLLGAAPGASRPVVDQGWLPFSRQIGQTGKVVSPQLYFALGISGASHHVLGLRNVRTIVAVNRDKRADIFKLAELKVAADLEALLPVLVEELRRRRRGKKDETTQ